MQVARWVRMQERTNAETYEGAKFAVNKHELLRLIEDLPYLKKEVAKLAKNGVKHPGDILAHLKRSKRVLKRVKFQARSEAKRNIRK